MNIPKDQNRVVARYFEHLVAEEWTEAARLLDPVFLKRFRESDAPHNSRPAQPITVEAHLERYPDMPREVAEYFVRQHSMLPPRRIADYFAGIESQEELDRLGDVELFARYLEAVDPSARYRRYLASLAEEYPEFADQLKGKMEDTHRTWRYEVLGSIDAGARSLVLFEHPGMREGAVPGYEPVPHVAVVIDRGDGPRIAHDPSPHTGMVASYAPITVLDSEGETVRLELRGGESV